MSNQWSQIEEMRKAFAELLGCDPETWPEHGNAPLAMTAAFALALKKAEASQTFGNLESDLPPKEIETPKPDLYYYEWDVYISAVHRSFSPALYNGVGPKRTFKVLAIEERK